MGTGKRRIIAIGLTLLAAAKAAEPAWQSLAELAKREAERRRILRELGVKGKVIEMPAAAAGEATGRVAISKPISAGRAETPLEAKKADGARTYRTRLQSLDGQIRKAGEQLRLLKARLEADRWAPPKVGRVGSRQKGGSSAEDLKWKIRELETRLNQLRVERREVYERGRKAGFLPGELEGRGITP